MTRHARPVQQQGEARGALHQGADRGAAAKTLNEVPSPVGRDGAISSLRWTLTLPGPPEGTPSNLRNRPLRALQHLLSFPDIMLRRAIVLVPHHPLHLTGWSAIQCRIGRR